MQGTGVYEAPNEAGATPTLIEGLDDLKADAAAFTSDSVFWINLENEVWGSRLAAADPVMIDADAGMHLRSDARAAY